MWPRPWASERRSPSRCPWSSRMWATGRPSDNRVRQKPESPPRKERLGFRGLNTPHGPPGRVAALDVGVLERQLLALRHTLDMGWSHALVVAEAACGP